jgi:hypothetical protein
VANTPHAGALDVSSAVTRRTTAPFVGQPFDLHDGYPIQVEKQRRIVDQARGSSVIVLRREQK